MKSPIKALIKIFGGNQSELARRMNLPRQQINDITKDGIIPEKHALLCEEISGGTVKAMDILVFNQSARSRIKKAA